MSHVGQQRTTQLAPRATRPRRLRRGIMALLSAMLLITLLGIGAGVFYFTVRNEQLVWQGRQGEAAGYASQTVANFLQHTQDDLTAVGLLHREDLQTVPDLLQHVLKQNQALLELLVLDRHGQVLAAAYRDTPVLSNLFTIKQSEWFLEAKASRSYLSDVQISANSQPYLIMAIPVPDGGVVAARLSMEMLWGVVRDIQFAETGGSYVVNQDGDIVAHTNPEVVLSSINIHGRPEMVALSQAPGHKWSGSYLNFEGIPVIGITEPVTGSEWVVITEVPESEARTVSRTALRLLTAGMLLFGVLVTGVTNRFLEHMIFRPMEELRDGAERIGDGDLSHRIPLTRQDEVGQVATAFNQMAGELQDLYTSLEGQVADRTRELELRSQYLEGATEVGHAATSILETDQLIQQVVELIRNRFDLYYVGLFLMDETGEWAILRAGTGEAGRAMLARGHRIQVGEGMVGWSVANVRARVALDAGQDAVRLATAELPYTRSEAALPLRSRGQVLGALTVQDTRPDAFDPGIIAVLQAMADQVGVALDNARLFAESQQALEATRRAYGELSREAWAEILRTRRDLGVCSDERGAVPVGDAWQPWMKTALQRGETTPGQDGTPALATPIKVRGQVIGVIDAYKPDGSGEWTAEEVALLEALTDQLGVALDSARLYQDTRRRAVREQLTREITDRIRSAISVEDAIQRAVQEMGRALGVSEMVARIGTEQDLLSTQGGNGHE